MGWGFGSRTAVKGSLSSARKLRCSQKPQRKRVTGIRADELGTRVEGFGFRVFRWNPSTSSKASNSRSKSEAPSGHERCNPMP